MTIKRMPAANSPWPMDLMILPMQRPARATHPACRALIVHGWAWMLKSGRVIARQMWQDGNITRGAVGRDRGARATRYLEEPGWSQPKISIRRSSHPVD